MKCIKYTLFKKPYREELKLATNVVDVRISRVINKTVLSSLSTSCTFFYIAYFEILSAYEENILKA